MTDSISKYFNDDYALDQISVTEIEQLIASAPYASAYKLLLAKKMSSQNNLVLPVFQNDRVMQHYLQQSHIPGVADLKKVEKISDLNLVISNAETTSMSKIEKEKEKDDIAEDLVPEQTSSEVDDKILNMDDQIEVTISEQPIQSDSSKPKRIKKKKKNKFKLNEYSGISDFSIWLLSFKKDDIDKQIIKEEKAAKKRALEESANKSVTKTDTIISEPLADILANQGHLDDAKKMYEQLMMKYPEKSSYFAAKINQLIKI